MHRSLVALFAATLLVMLSAPALAGGWASVHLDEPPGAVLVEQPWEIGFRVLQHDITPTNEVTPVVRARHQESGEEITFAGMQTGEVGHFVAEVIFPQAGDWKWSIIPEPFAETSFATLTVRESLLDDTPIYPASIVSGVCAAPGDEAFSLGNVELPPTAVKSTQLPVALGSANVDASLPELMASRHAIALQASPTDPAPIACGDIDDLSGSARSSREPLVLGLQGWENARNVGVAVLRGVGERTEVTVYLLDPEKPSVAPVPVALATVEIDGDLADGSMFSPVLLAVAPGTRITWVNHSDVAHMVTGDDLALDDSGWIAPGASFSLTLSEPGEFHYRCGPHPWMEGTIVVA